MYKYAPKVIYFLKPVGLPGPIKIGCSCDRRLRLEEINRWSPIPLEMIGFTHGDHSDESFIHNCFFEFHSHGEWFFPTNFVVHSIQNILSDGVAYARLHMQPRGMLRGRPHSPETRQKMRRSQQLRQAKKIERENQPLRGVR